VADVAGRDYQLALDGSARYVLTAPVESNDQLDWNKLPGLSDCGTVDLSVDGAMFGWRWRPDLDPPVLELTAYANEAGVHATAAAPLAVLDAADLDAAEPLRYRVWRDDAAYGFTIEGAVRGRPVSATTTLPRRCAGERRDVLAWASGLYFGGTSTAPQRITARVLEQRFVPAP
jgi:hypothetical protein